MTRRRSQWVLVGVVVLYVVLATVYSVTTPVFEAPDESYHFFVVKHIVDHRALPVQRLETRDRWEQEGSQPPLYYVVGALLVSGIDLTDIETLMWRNPQANIGDPANPGNKNVYIHPPGQRFPWRGAVLAVHILRFLSLAFGAATVVTAWHLGRLVFPGQYVLPLAAAAVTAFVPQFLFITSSVSNDNSLTFFGALSLYLLLHLLRDSASNDAQGGVPVGEWGILGVVLGLALLSKLSALALLVPAGLVIALVAWRRRSWRLVWGAGLCVAVPVVVLAGWWYVRNVALYGEPTGLTAMWEVVGRRDDFGQDLWGELRALRYSFWGLFGWFSITLPGWVYWTLDALSLLAVAGLCLRAARWTSLGRWRAAWSAFHYREPGWGAAFLPLALGQMWLWLGIIFVSLVRWTSLTHGTQGRLLFPALVPWSLSLVIGSRAWFPPRLRDGASVMLAGGLLVLAALAPWLWIGPAYAHPSQIDKLPASAIPLDQVFGDAIALRGVGFEQNQVRAGQVLQVRLYWETLRSMGDGADIVVVLRLVDPLGAFVGVEDSYLGAGTLPASLWPVNALLAGRQYVLVGADVDAPLVARLSVAMVDGESGKQLAIPGGEPIIGRIKVAPRQWPRASRREAVAHLEWETSPGTRPASGALLVRPEWPAVVHAGEVLPVRLVWVVQSPPGRDYTVFVHLEDEAGNVYGYGDGAPRAGRYPTWIWAQDEVIVDEHAVLVDANTPPGRYHIVVGMYDARARVPAFAPPGTRLPDDAVDLGTVEVR